MAIARVIQGSVMIMMQQQSSNRGHGDADGDGSFVDHKWVGSLAWTPLWYSFRSPQVENPNATSSESIT